MKKRCFSEAPVSLLSFTSSLRLHRLRPFLPQVSSAPQEAGHHGEGVQARQATRVEARQSHSEGAGPGWLKRRGPGRNWHGRAGIRD